MNIITRYRVAWRLARVVSQTTRLTSIERRKPRDDRRSFIVVCDAEGRLDVSYYDDSDEYRADFERFDEDPDVSWLAAYDKWADRGDAR